MKIKVMFEKTNGTMWFFNMYLDKIMQSIYKSGKSLTRRLRFYKQNNLLTLLQILY